MPQARKVNPAPAPQGSNDPNTPDPGDSEAQSPTEKRDDAPFYCPGCGRRWNFPAECRGASEAAPHAPIEVVSTDELDGDPEDHTAAPDSV